MGRHLVCVRHAWGLFLSYRHGSKRIHRRSTAAHDIAGPSLPRIGGCYRRCIYSARQGAWLPRDQLPAALYPPRRAGRMTVIAIAGVDPQGMVHWSTRLVHALAVRVDSTAARLTSFLEGRLARTLSGS